MSDIRFHRRRGLLAALIAGPLLAAGAAQARKQRKVYGVIFEITVDAEGRLATLKVAKVIDIDSGSIDGVNVPIPEVYLAAAKAEFGALTFEPANKPFFMYRFFDPARPDTVLQSPVG